MDLTMLKTHLGDELYAQVEEKLGGLDGFQVIATNDGSWMPKARLDAEITKRKDLQTTVNSLTGELNEAKKQLEASGSLKDQVDKLTADLAERDQTITGMRRSGKIREVLAKANAKDIGVLEKLLDDSQISEDDKGNLTGVDEQIKALRENSAYLFNDAASFKGGFGGGKNPNTGNGGGENSNVNEAIRRAAGRM